MRKEVKIIMAIIVALSIVLLATSVYADEINPDQFKGTPVNGLDGVAETNEIDGFDNVAGTVIGIVQTVGTIIAIVIVIWVGIQYLMASTEQKAEYKTKMIAYLVGALLVFAGPRVVSVIYNAAQNLEF